MIENIVKFLDLKPRNETVYEIVINFKPETSRQSIENALMPRREYRRMLKEHAAGRPSGTYEFLLDGHVAEMTFPIQDIDTIHALPRIKDDE